MSNTVIRVEKVSKLYKLGEIGTGSISSDVSRWMSKTFSGNDPYSKLNSPKKLVERDFWALKDVSFDVNQGEVLGIIGKNGAGKSTLLKILSRITSPTSGNVKIKGRIASLLEVGTGFHPELSGRDNIYLNGSFLGMKRREIDKKFDEIVDFSGIGKFIDTPVKRYSSGMYVRLAFAVAAHLEPEILIIDEVLAVGDAEFQKKCLGKMNEVSQKEGRTVLFVSHSISAIQKLCKTGLLLKDGAILQSDTIANIIPNYLKVEHENLSEFEFGIKNPEDLDAFAYKGSLEDLNGNPLNEILVGQPWRFKVYFRVNKVISNLIIALGMADANEVPIRTSWQLSNTYYPGDYIAYFEENEVKFSVGRYKIFIGLSIGKMNIQYLDNDIWISISEIDGGIDKSVMDSTNGILNNQMEMYVQHI